MFRRKERPKFTCQRQAAYPHAKFIGTATLMRQRRKKSRIHDDMPAMSIRMTFCKFNGFTNHDAHRDLSNTFAGSQTERFADVITIVDKGLWKQIRETLPQKAFAFRSGIDNQMRAAQCFCHLYFFVDGLHQRFCRKGTHDAGSAIPPTMPNFGLKVLTANSFPPGTAIVMLTPRSTPARRRSFPVSAIIMRRGTGLMAGSPTASPKPGRVTVPTPSPA